jgi:hypothetical protein
MDGCQSPVFLSNGCADTIYPRSNVQRFNYQLLGKIVEDNAYSDLSLDQSHA